MRATRPSFRPYFRLCVVINRACMCHVGAPGTLSTDRAMRVDEPGEVQRLRREVMLLQGCCLGVTLDAAGLERSDGRRALQPKQHTEALAHIDHDVGRSLRLKHDASSMPVKILDVVRENNSGDLPTRR